jgi:3-oxoacyl-[acyl-carrier-protein] synthase-3
MVKTLHFTSAALLSITQRSLRACLSEDSRVLLFISQTFFELCGTYQFPKFKVSRAEYYLITLILQNRDNLWYNLRKFLIKRNKMGIKILGTGSYLPPQVVTNDDIAQALDTSDEWIYSHTGIRSRHVAGEGESTSTMAVEAAKSAMAAANVAPEDIGLIIVATSTPDYNPFPSTACVVQGALGCVNAGAFDLQAACAGFVYALEQARGFVNFYPDKKALVIGAESLTRILDWTDRASCILFGDGAGAVVLGNDAPPGMASTETKAHTILGADGKGSHFIMRSGGCKDSIGVKPGGVMVKPVPHLCELTLMGHDVFAFAVKALSKVARDLCDKLGTKPEELDRVFAHQANGRIIEATARRMKLPLEKFWLNLETTANTSAASIPISLDQAVRAGELKDGMKIVMVGFGAGLTYAGTYCTWPNL